jgi:hypothetical protein
MSTSDTVSTLRQAADGLTYPSETDAPWAAFAWPDATGTPTADEVRRRGRLKPSAPVEEQSVDQLFQSLVEEQDWFGESEKAEAAKNRTLRDAVKNTLTETRVFRIGTRKVTVYVVGRTKEGGWAGLKTTAVET